ncbi:dermokine [Balaenoptera ricei]|uniref:dermokine n=1 Tax=Balaenoptera ricei TaxID=2746895 RepID=UPI0028BE682E|nr:dermokine [Balaenoptera ricei]
MKLQGSLACLLLVLCLGSGEAGPLLSGGESAGAGVMEATGHGVGEAIGQEVGEAIKHGVGEATGGGDGGAAGSGVKEAMGPGVGDDLAHGVEDAAHALGNTGSEADRQAENVIQRGVDAAHSSRQGMPGGNGALGAHGQPPSGGHGPSGSPGNPGGPGIPWDHVYSGGSGGSFGTNSQGGSRGHGGHGGAFNVGTNTQAAVAQTPYGSGRGSDKPNAESQTSPVPFPLQCTNRLPSGSGGSSSNSGGRSSGGGSSNSSSGGSSGGSSGLHWVSSPLLKAEVGPLVVPAEETHSEVFLKAASPRKTLEILIKAATPRPHVDSRFPLLGYNTSFSSGSRAGSGGNKPEVSSWELRVFSFSLPPCDNPRSEVHVSGESGGQGQGSSGGGEAVNRTNTLNSQTSPGLFNFDAFWMNLKFMLGFNNWDAINKGQVSKPSTRILLYFRRLWENFKRNTPFLNWKAIIEGPFLSPKDMVEYRQDTEVLTSPPLVFSLQWGVTISSSASRARPDLLQWVKFWDREMKGGQEAPCQLSDALRDCKFPEGTTEGITVGKNVPGPDEATYAQLLNVDKLRSVLEGNDFLNWHALIESVKRKLPFLNWDAFPKLRGMSRAAADAQ